MKFVYSVVCFITLVFTIFACSNNNRDKHKNSSQIKSDSNYQKIDFVKFITKHKNDTLDFYEELLTKNDFRNILEHSEYYIDDVFRFLNTGKFNNIQVGICICAMQNLRLKDYVKFCNLILTLYNQDKLSEGILEDAVSPDFLHKRIIINNYNDPEVIKLIKIIQQNKKISNSDFKKWLPEFLSGKSSKDLKEFDKDNNQ